MPLCFHGFIHPAAFIHLIFYKNEIGRLRYASTDIIRQIIPPGLKKTGVFKYDQPAL